MVGGMVGGFDEGVKGEEREFEEKWQEKRNECTDISLIRRLLNLLYFSLFFW